MLAKFTHKNLNRISVFPTITLCVRFFAVLICELFLCSSGAAAEKQEILEIVDIIRFFFAPHSPKNTRQCAADTDSAPQEVKTSLA